MREVEVIVDAPGTPVHALDLDGLSLVCTNKSIDAKARYCVADSHFAVRYLPHTPLVHG